MLTGRTDSARTDEKGVFHVSGLLVGGGVLQTEQAGRETCALTFTHS